MHARAQLIRESTLSVGSVIWPDGGTHKKSPHEGVRPRVAPWSVDLTIYTSGGDP